MKIAILTLGCKTNQAESHQIELGLIHSGHKIVDLQGQPDLCIINTCSVTAKADSQSRQLINRVIKNKSQLIVTGCYSEMNAENISKLNADIRIVKNSDKHNIISMLPSDISSHNERNNNEFRHRPFVKVQDGCNYSCSYCAIPVARGSSRSERAADILNKIIDLESMGYQEIVLTGIHLGAYGLDMSPPIYLHHLLSDILSRTSIKRIRLGSIEISEISNELLEVCSDKRICEHFHIPIQSGADKILRLMNRSYSVRDLLAGVEAIMNKKPDISIGTDVIVGFPGEDLTEFENTRQLIDALPFSYLHVFPYSERPFTKAITLSDKVREPEKKERVQILRELGAIKRISYIQKNIGKVHDTVVETSKDNGFTGTTGNYIKVFVPESKGIQEGALVNVKISGYMDATATGFLVNKL